VRSGIFFQQHFAETVLFEELPHTGFYVFRVTGEEFHGGSILYSRWAQAIDKHKDQGRDGMSCWNTVKSKAAQNNMHQHPAVAGMISHLKFFGQAPFRFPVFVT
jgi:hypothetical protein